MEGLLLGIIMFVSVLIYMVYDWYSEFKRIADRLDVTPDELRKYLRNNKRYLKELTKRYYHKIHDEEES